MSFEFSGELWHWRGPAPYYFVTVPAAECRTIKSASKLVTYGWGMIPVQARIGKTQWQTSLFPKQGLYVVPIKDSVRQAEGLEEGDDVVVCLEVQERSKKRQEASGVQR